MNFLLSTILIWKQLIINLIEWCRPACLKCSSFRKVKQHFNKIEVLDTENDLDDIKSPTKGPSEDPE